MCEFKKYNPLVNFMYFIASIGFSMFMMHPVFLCISLVGAIILSIMETDLKKTLKTFLLFLPFAIVMGAINPLFNHKGATILGYFPDGNPLTAESVYYGIGASVMLLSVILYFSCYNKVLTSDKFIYLFGKTVPVLSLVISMILRFIPRMGLQAKVIVDGQKAMGRPPSEGNILTKCRRWIKVVSILITWSLENAIEVSDSMKSRGYGLPGRTTFSIFRFDKRDAAALVWIGINSVTVLLGVVTGYTYYSYFPALEADFSGISILFYTSYLLLLLTPFIIERRESVRWTALK